jgi:hypothetical protein
MSNISKILLFVTLMSVSLFAGTESASKRLIVVIDSSFLEILFIVKIFGFIMIMWGIGGLVSEDKSGDGSQYIISAMKVFAGSILMASEKLSYTLEIVEKG